VDGITNDLVSKERLESRMLFVEAVLLYGAVIDLSTNVDSKTSLVPEQ